MDHRVRSDDDVAAQLQAAAAGDRRGWDALVERFSSLLWSVARAHRLGAEDAADVVQTTWLRLLDHLDRIEEPERLAGWLATTARHECLHLLRRTSRDALLPEAGALEVIPDPRVGPDDVVIEQDRDALLWALVDQLDAGCRRLLRVLFATPPPSYAEVSAATGMAVGSIGPTRARCLGRLRGAAVERGLEPEHHDDAGGVS